TITRYFEVEDDEYDDDLSEDLDAWLVINFVDDREDKEAEINVNGHVTILDQREREYRRKINSWIERENNYVGITPLSTLYIVDIQVDLV
ncbi:MAG: hypothetical protein QF632_01420, partial [Candidatus Woesearchaeota archaeon]|nr:hypothetical protein [Candidatus Woesearchaeota archaeon]